MSSEYAGRWVSFLFAPLIAIASAFVANEAQMLFNLNLDKTQLVIFLTGIVLGVFHVIQKWVENKGKYEIAEEFHISVEELEAIGHGVEEVAPLPAAAKVGTPKPKG